MLPTGDSVDMVDVRGGSAAVCVRTSRCVFSVLLDDVTSKTWIERLAMSTLEWLALVVWL